MTAAREHFAEVDHMVSEGIQHYPLAYYLTGVSVECLLRAYMVLVGATFDEKHDLRKLAQSSQFFSFMPSGQREELEDALAEVYKRWDNGIRYCSKTRLRRFLVAPDEGSGALTIGQNQRPIKGDLVVYHWDILYKSSDRIITWGVNKWETSKAKWNG